MRGPGGDPVRRAVRRWAMWVLGALVLAPVLIYLLASVWLESAGGRGALERELARRAGMPVRLLGDFDIELFPSLGVGGTDLVVGGPAADGEMARSGAYSVAVALRPLLRRNLEVVSIRLADVTLWLDRLPSGTGSSPNEPLRLPAIDEFRVSRLRIVPAGESGQPFQVDELVIEGFAEGRDSAIRVEAAGFGLVDGRLRWDSDRSVLNLEGSWLDAWPGDLRFELQADFAAAAGQLAAQWPARPEPGADQLAVSTRFTVREAAIGLRDLEARAGTQTVRGGGCVVMGAAPALKLDLAADELDFDSLPSLPPGLTAPGAGGAATPGLQVDARLAVGVLRAADAVAHDAVLAMGDAPECGPLE